METLTLRLFMVVWVAMLLYISMAAVLGFRLNKLRRSGRAPAAPDIFHPFSTTAYFRYLFSNDYRALDDPIVSRLVPVIRVWLVALVPAFVAVVVLMWAPVLF